MLNGTMKGTLRMRAILVKPLIGLILLFPLGLAAACVATSQQITPAEEFTAKQLFADYNSEYEDNRLAAEKNYTGRTFLVTGVVADIGRDFIPCRTYGICEGNPYITLSAGQVLKIVGVKCKFPDKDVAGLLGISKGQSVTVKGKFEGRGILDVELSGCILQ